MKLILILILIFSFKAFSQTNQMEDEQRMMQKQIEEIMKHRQEMLRSLLNDDSFGDMEKQMQEMTKRFFDNDDFTSGNVVGEYNWNENEKYRILSLKVKQIKDQPLDIKIEKGQIKIKGDVEEVSKNKAKTKIHFERMFSIPRDVDDKNPEFENKAGELLIKFKKKSISAPKSKTPERVPVVPDKKEVNI